MFYTVYKITNTKNGKYYIGCHRTTNLDDGYFGSGVYLNRALAKHGIESFVREILHVFDNKEEMFAKEKELVCVSEETYNLKPGGSGGWIIFSNEEYRRRAKIGGIMHTRRLRSDPEYMKQRNKFHSDLWKNPEYRANQCRLIREWHANNPNAMLGKKHTEDTKRRIGEANSKLQSGKKNSQYGTCWIFNSEGNKKIPKSELKSWLAKGYVRGRKM